MSAKTQEQRKKQYRNRGILAMVLLVLFVACGAWLILHFNFWGSDAQPNDVSASTGAGAAATEGAPVVANPDPQPENPVPAEPMNANQEKIVTLAKQEFDGWDGKHSKYGPSGEWCGDFAAWVLNTATGIKKPSNYPLANAWKNVSGKLSYHEGRDGLQPGDFVLYDVDTTNAPSVSGAAHNGTANHINIYVGNGNVIGGNQSGAVTERNLDDYLVNLTPTLKKGDPGYADYTFYVLGYIRVSDQ